MLTKLSKTLLLLSFVLITGTTMAQNTPIIDREIFFGNPEISSGELSPDGKYIAFMKEHEGIMNLWLKTFDQPFDQAVLLTESSSPIMGFFWTYDSRYILYVNDEGGDENINIFALDPAEATQSAVPKSRNLTPMKEVTAQIYQVSRKNPDQLMVGINDRDKAWHDLYRLTISTGELELLFENNNRYTGWDFDWDEKLRLGYRTDEQGNSEILRVNEDGTFKKIYSTDISEQAYVNGWTPDNKKCYLVSNKGDVDLSTLYLMDPSDGSTTYMESDPQKKVDFGGMFIDDNTHEILYTSYVYDKRERHWKNKDWEKMFAKLEKQLPGREVGFVSFTKDYKKMLIAASGDQFATDVYYYDVEADKLTHQYTPRPKLKEVEKHLSSMQPISYKSSDGLEIPAYLSLPAGVEAKNLPVVMFIHGGPKGPRDYWGFNGRVQLLTNRGYAVLQPNFRASGGYGKSFLNAGDKQWGKKMQDDITWGVKYLIDQGIADPKRVAIMGGSYGGYATLAGMAFTPEVYACGVDIVGPSNLFTLLESIPAYWESGRTWFYEMVGDPDTEEGKKLLTEASPLFSADKIQNPLLIVQGANDPRVKKAEADQIVIALRDKGQQVDYLLAEDEGHGFRKPLNRQAMWAETEKFLAEHLGGRYQKEMPADVQQTLEKLTVDISTVTYTPAAEVSTADQLDIEKASLKTGDYNYDMSIEVQGQTIPMQLTRSIAQDGDLWTITESASSPMGDMSDMAVYDQTLLPTKRDIDQGGQKVNISYDGKLAQVTAMGNQIPVEAPSLLIGDGPGFDLLVAHLGLSDGEQLSYYTLDMTSMKPKQIRIQHKGSETLDGKSMDYYEVTSVENPSDITKLWIDPSRQMAVKTISVAPAMGNAIVTITLK